MPPYLAVPRPPFQALALVVLCLGAYWPSLDNGFFFDDITRIVENPGIRQVTPLSRFLTQPRLSASEKRIANFRPLLSLSLAVDHARGGLAPTPYRQTQLVTHAATTLATWGALGALLGPVAPGAAFWAAALVATHPVSGVAVRYLSARDLLQMQFFLMATLGLYLRWRRKADLDPLRWAALLGLLSLGLLAKKNGAVFPLVVLWIETVLPDHSGRPPGWLVGLRRAALFAIPVVLVGGAARIFLGHDELSMVLRASEPLSLTYLATQAWVHWRYYLAGFLIPWTLHLEPAVQPLSWGSPRAVLGAVAIAAILALAWRLRRNHPEAATCLASYWILLLPTSSVLHLFAPSVPYRPYPSSVFLFGGLTLLLAQQARGSRGTWIAGALVAASVATAWSTDVLWQDAQAVWSHSVSRGGSSKALISLAAQEEDPATRARLLEQNLQASQGEAMLGLVLAEAWFRLGRREQALGLVRQVRRQVGTEPRYHELAGRLLLAEGEVPEALAAARDAFRFDPDSITVRLLLAQALQSSGEVLASAPHLAYVARQAPGYADVDLRQGYLAEAEGDQAQAEHLYRTFLARHPESAVGARYLGSILFRQGKFAEAVEHLEAAHEGGQRSRELDQQLWASYRQLGKSSSAAAVLARLRRSPGR